MGTTTTTERAHYLPTGPVHHTWDVSDGQIGLFRGAPSRRGERLG